MSTESIEQFSRGLTYKEKKKKSRLRFSRNRLSRMFLHLFVCCVVPSEHFLDIEKQGNKKNKEVNTLDLELEEENDTKNAFLENQLDISKVLTNRNSISIDEEKMDILLGNYGTREAEINYSIKKPLFLDTSDNADLSHSITDSLGPSVHSKWLLGPVLEADKGKKCLVLDLDETLVHSSFKVIHQADFIIPVKIDSTYHNVYVIKRPGVDSFMKRMGELFEIVVFTASLSKYADPVLDMLDIHHVVKHRLFRESCFNHQGNYVKNLSQLGRELKNVLIIDNSPASYVFHPTHAVPISSWFNDSHDTELLDLIPFLEDLTTVPDVTTVLDLGLHES
ncbi:hypothetical protein PNEG_00792 [Pneumocystis murina B123]|uniref:FCP1 homology domain-containing protein n=1 Tax=Pneumocystis murina (strain B123) TaxID=1069680 RepID=M7PBD6_PNEMU|nr:hypothetical protein PNEG_00792 [Pneumocystis murina B123]EMR11200.1 hypothetical protein PNEG_00792 [Pneumocystis murina B123]